MNAKKSGGGSQYFLIIFGVIWTAISAVVFFISFSEGGNGPGPILGGIFLVIGLGVLAYTLLVAFSRFKVGRSEVTLSKQHNLAVGETFTMNLNHNFRRRVSTNSFTVSLIFREKATYQQSTDTKTVTHEDVINFYEEGEFTYESGEYLQRNYEFQIPADGMHTLKVRRNELTWILQVKIEVASLPDYIDEYELTVLPQVLTHV